MPTFRQDLRALAPYVPGRPIEAVAGELGIAPDQVVKLASNESPDGPFPGVNEAVAGTLGDSNRYPDNDVIQLLEPLSKWLGVPTDHLWPGAGSVALLSHIALAVGGPGTSALFAWPSFVMYRNVSRWAMSETVEVSLTPDFLHDLEAMSAAVPCVASDVGGNRAILSDGETGLLVPPGDPAALAGALERVLTDEALAGARARRAREHIVRTYDLGALVAREIALLRRLAGRR